MVKIGNSFLVVIPSEIKKHLASNKGDYLVWIINKNNEVVLEKLTPKKYPGFFVQETGYTRYVKR